MTPPTDQSVNLDDLRVAYDVVDDGTIALITMTRERYRNPLSRQMMAELQAAFERADEDEQVRVIILKGSGPHFSAGHDLGSPDAVQMRAESDGETVAQRLRRTTAMDQAPHLYIRSIPKPTIAMVRGMCVYASWMLASATDVIFADSDARFLATNFSYFTAPWELGARRAKYHLFGTQFMDAQEAKRAGFVSDVFTPEALEDETMAYARKVAGGDPFQLAMMKHSINQMQHVQGFHAHILSSFIDRAVRAQNSSPITRDPGDGSRRRYLSVERAQGRLGDG